MIFDVSIPMLPPGVNQTYIRHGFGVALSKAARVWDEEAALLIGGRAGELGWQFNEADCPYALVIRWGGGRHDNDAHLKLVQDCLTRKLGFDDRLISLSVIEKIDGMDGMRVYLMPNDYLSYEIKEKQDG